MMMSHMYLNLPNSSQAMRKDLDTDEVGGSEMESSKQSIREHNYQQQPQTIERNESKLDSGSRTDKEESRLQRELLKAEYLKLKQELKLLAQKQQERQIGRTNNKSTLKERPKQEDKSHSVRSAKKQNVQHDSNPHRAHDMKNNYNQEVGRSSKYTTSKITRDELKSNKITHSPLGHYQTQATQKQFQTFDGRQKQSNKTDYKINYSTFDNQANHPHHFQSIEKNSKRTSKIRFQINCSEFRPSTPSQYHEHQSSSQLNSQKKKNCRRCLSKQASRSKSRSKQREESASSAGSNNKSLRTLVSNLQIDLRKNLQDKDILTQEKTKPGDISPSKLNQELNRILETEQQIKKYKEMITKMQRDYYSKKESDGSQTRASFLAHKKTFQEDIAPKLALEQMTSAQRHESCKEIMESVLDAKIESADKSRSILCPYDERERAEELAMQEFVAFENQILTPNDKTITNFSQDFVLTDDSPKKSFRFPQENTNYEKNQVIFDIQIPQSTHNQELIQNPVKVVSINIPIKKQVAQARVTQQSNHTLRHMTPQKARPNTQMQQYSSLKTQKLRQQAKPQIPRPQTRQKESRNSNFNSKQNSLQNTSELVQRLLNQSPISSSRRSSLENSRPASRAQAVQNKTIDLTKIYNSVKQGKIHSGITSKALTIRRGSHQQTEHKTPVIKLSINKC